MTLQNDYSPGPGETEEEIQSRRNALPQLKGSCPSDATACFGSAAVRDLERHDAAWVKHFVKPVARFMRERGISEVRIKIGKDGKASYLLEPDAEWLGDSIQNEKSPCAGATEKDHE